MDPRRSSPQVQPILKLGADVSPWRLKSTFSHLSATSSHMPKNTAVKPIREAAMSKATRLVGLSAFTNRSQ